MKHEPNGPSLAAVFVDYDNIYLSLRRKNEEAAKRFSKDAGFWIKEITTGGLITPTNGMISAHNRRLVMARCYGNPVPRRNTKDNSTDMNSFPFVRHHFLRGGFEVVDCPPLTAQLKNSADIRMVMDMRDLLNHDSYYDEFIILSSDADFTPMLHRLRAHARHTVIYANDYTAAPYTAICDGEIRESDLLKLLLDGKVIAPGESDEVVSESTSSSNDRIRAEIITTVVTAVRAAEGPVPLEALAERTTRALGHDQTVGSSWAGAGSFLELLRKELPTDVMLTAEAPYLACDARRAVEPKQNAPASQEQPIVPTRQPQTGAAVHDAYEQAPAPQPQAIARTVAEPLPPMRQPADTQVMDMPAAAVPQVQHTSERPQLENPEVKLDSTSEALQKSLIRIRDASQVPALSPSDYRKLFVVMAQEINENNLQGAQTISNIMTRAAERNVEVGRDDLRFIIEVVSEADPWFEQGASANLFAGRFHNFVVARCRSQGLDLSIRDLDLIEMWFAGNGEPIVAPNDPSIRPIGSTAEIAGRAAASPPQNTAPQRDEDAADDFGRDDFPRILQNRRRG